jgi:hypothetical protein
MSPLFTRQTCDAFLPSSPANHVTHVSPVSPLFTRLAYNACLPSSPAKHMCFCINHMFTALRFRSSAVYCDYCLLFSLSTCLSCCFSFFHAVFTRLTRSFTSRLRYFPPKISFLFVVIIICLMFYLSLTLCFSETCISLCYYSMHNVFSTISN